MLKYKIETARGKNPIARVVFQDKKYALAAEFLLAEARSFGSEILGAIGAVTSGEKSRGAFSGNAFSLEISPEVTRITNDITDRECVIPTAELKSVAESYVEKCGELSRRSDAAKKK